VDPTSVNVQDDELAVITADRAIEEDGRPPSTLDSSDVTR
jgi:hypothetical protein